MAWEGLILFSIGMFKKLILADNLAPVANSVFNNAESVSNGFIALLGSLAYTFQLYFDFSGYSDMAIGIGLMFGVRIPLNFNSPYKARNISEFWIRWHITLSTFLRDYLYIPLGGNRNGTFKRYRNLMLTMLLGGLWHGAGWNFMIWGGLNGLYLVVHQVSLVRVPQGILKLFSSKISIAFTFFCTVLAWIFFRAETFDGAFNIAATMLSLVSYNLVDLGSFAKINDLNSFAILLALSLLICFVLPNSQRFAEKMLKENSRYKMLKPVLISIAFSVCLYKLIYFSNLTPEFLYFDF